MHSASIAHVPYVVTIAGLNEIKNACYVVIDFKFSGSRYGFSG